MQVVFDHPDRPDIFAEAERIRGEYVLAVKGKVRPRPEGTVNPNMSTGQVEVLAHELMTLNDSETPPFHHEEHANEELRLKYRYHRPAPRTDAWQSAVAARSDPGDEKIPRQQWFH